MCWYVLVRSQIKFDTYLVEYLNRKCTEANQEQSIYKKKKSKHWENILNFWQRIWTAWIPMTLWVIISDSFCHISGSYIFIYQTVCVRLSRLDGFLKNVLLWHKAGQCGCHFVICVAPTTLHSLNAKERRGLAALHGTWLPSALPEAMMKSRVAQQ